MILLIIITIVCYCYTSEPPLISVIVLTERTLGGNQVEMKEAPGGKVAEKMLTVIMIAVTATTAATTVNPELRPEVRMKVRRLLIKLESLDHHVAFLHEVIVFEAKKQKEILYVATRWCHFTGKY